MTPLIAARCALARAREAIRAFDRAQADVTDPDARQGLAKGIGSVYDQASAACRPFVRKRTERETVTIPQYKRGEVRRMAEPGLKVGT